MDTDVPVPGHIDESWKEPSKSSNKKGTFSSDNTADIGKIDFRQEQNACHQAGDRSLSCRVKSCLKKQISLHEALYFC